MWGGVKPEILKIWPRSHVPYGKQIFAACIVNGKLEQHAEILKF